MDSDHGVGVLGNFTRVKPPGPSMALSWPTHPQHGGEVTLVRIIPPALFAGRVGVGGDAGAYQSFGVLNDFTRVKSWVRWLVPASANRSGGQSKVRNLCAQFGLGFRLWSRCSGKLHAREVSRSLDGIILGTTMARRRKMPLVSSNPSSFWARCVGRRTRCCCGPWPKCVE